MDLHIRIASVSQRPQLFQFREDKEIFGELRGCAVNGCPAVMTLREGYDTKFTRQWQYFLYAINKGMTLAAIIAKLGDENALANKTGFRESDPKNNYLTGNVGYKNDPWLDKLRTFSRNTHAGIIEGDNIRVTTFDGNNDPPLKPGRIYPRTLSNVSLDDYLYIPQTHPWLFLVCNNVRYMPGGSIVFPFAHGVVRPWLDDQIYTFFPLVSKFKILSPRWKWIELPKDAPIPSPYRRVV